jgi:hypothetical protein
MIIGQCESEEPTSWIRIRSEEILFKTDFSNINYLFIAGSFDSDIDPRPYMKLSLLPLLTTYPHLRICAIGSGACLLAPLVNLEVI